MLIAVILILVSCGNDLENDNKVKTPIQDTIVSEQTTEFRAINDLLKDDINNTALYLRRANLYKKYGDIGIAYVCIDQNENVSVIKICCMMCV